MLGRPGPQHQTLLPVRPEHGAQETRGPEIVCLNCDSGVPGAPSDGPHQVTHNPLPPREPVTVSAFPAMSPQAQPLPEASLAYRGASMSRSKSRYGPRRSLEEK